MAGLPPRVGAITLFVEDLARSKDFYRRVFGREPVNEDAEGVTFSLDDLYLNVLLARAAVELIEPAPVGAVDAGARFQLTVWVESADAACAAMAERGITVLNGPMDRPWGVRTAAFADPDGHVWEIGQQLPAHGAA